MACGGDTNHHDVARIVARILGMRRSHPIRVGVDGPSGAGKTTLADSVARALRTTTRRQIIRAELDHFMCMVPGLDGFPYDSAENFYARAWDCPAIRDRLLCPLGDGGSRRFRTAGTDAHAPVDRLAAADAILIADGVFLQRPALDAHWDLRIYVEVTPQESLRRCVARDRHWLGSAEQARWRHANLYRPAQERYVDRVDPVSRAHIVVDGTAWPHAIG
ncbi:hypothetical protein [Mangrovihabitans endophyticus]|uniref:Phosphoribulokinase/uridine kinase domain-containing protein n=1 Tax=Mangrovihabitans endophyticus TaxID=1751298 RepID=A0A8J3C076_9ACTN|nr:hypothetical protein [Mangrovihabitans endophyticus]GGK88214.1 hypothetical protein GCM10012284_22860 [Mangrovihabitans endophyticus]